MSENEDARKLVAELHAKIKILFIPICGFYKGYNFVQESLFLNVFTTVTSACTGLVSALIIYLKLNNTTSIFDYNALNFGWGAALAISGLISILTSYYTITPFYNQNDRYMKFLIEIVKLRKNGIKYFNDINEKYVTNNDELLKRLNEGKYKKISANYVTYIVQH